MREERYQLMILDYLDGNLTEEQLMEFKELIKAGQILVEEVEALQSTISGFSALPEPTPGPGLEEKFSRMLSAKIEQAEVEKPQLKWASFWESIEAFLNPVKLAYTLVVFCFGFFAAWLAFSNQPQQTPQNSETQQLAMELREVKQVLFTTLIEQPTAVERLKAVNISHEITDADNKVMDALFNSLNHDPNVNVRLAAIEALKLHTAKPEVRERLILSINKQESPMVQIALADLMQALQEKNALPQLRKLLQDENTNEFVKDKVQESINVLI